MIQDYQKVPQVNREGLIAAVNPLSYFKRIEDHGIPPIEVTQSPPDMINNPPHYTKGKIEPIDVIEDWKLGFNDGNAVKYIARAPHKGTQLQDLKKARWYLDRLIQQLEGKTIAD